MFPRRPLHACFRNHEPATLPSDDGKGGTSMGGSGGCEGSVVACGEELTDRGVGGGRIWQENGAGASEGEAAGMGMSEGEAAASKGVMVLALNSIVCGESSVAKLTL